MNYLNYFTWKKDNLHCEKCNWKGIGKDAELGDIIGGLADVLCPKCNNEIGVIGSASSEKTMKHGTEEQKMEEIKLQEYFKRQENSELKDKEQLPYINSNNLVFISDEETDANNDKWLVISNNENEIWREIVGWEYQHRFIQIGRMFLEKHDKKMSDFVQCDSPYFNGDSWQTGIKKNQKESYKK